MTEWADIVSNDDLKFMEKPGLNWYCSTGQPKLSDYLPIKPLEESFITLVTEVRNMARLVSENLEISKTAAVPPINNDLRDMTASAKKELLEAKNS